MESTDEARARANAAMERYADGDDAAFADLYRALSPRLLAFLVRMCGGARAQAEDLLQQTFLRIHGARGSFLAGADVSPWAFAIARRLFLDDRRRGKREQIEADEELAALLPIVQAEQDGAVDARILAGHIARALSAMPENQRTAFELVRRDGLSMAEAAAVLGVSEGAVKVRAHRAYEALRRALEDARIDGDTPRRQDPRREP